MNFNIIEQDFQQRLDAVNTLQELDQLRVYLLGNHGVLKSEMRRLANMPHDLRREHGSSLNNIRNVILQKISAKQQLLRAMELQQKLSIESIDITLPSREYRRGKTHPLTQVISEVKHIFRLLGFTLVNGTEIEDEWHNFTALNISKNHPARQLHDTFYITGKENLLLRTHTSPVQVRYIEDSISKLKHNALGHKGIKIISIGKVYRADFDATHTPMFHQLECLYINYDANFSILKGYINAFLQLFFNMSNIALRFRSSYFPFTEPSAEVDIRCDFSQNSAAEVCSSGSWLEVLGCGMIHDNVLQNMGLDPVCHSGFAFGVGIERLAMLKYNISDLRNFFTGNLQWLQHYGF